VTVDKVVAAGAAGSLCAPRLRFKNTWKSNYKPARRAIFAPLQGEMESSLPPPTSSGGHRDPSDESDSVGAELALVKSKAAA
jgi:hypothetical protein